MVDPVRLELIKNALVMVSDNMMVSVLRTSRSTLVKSNMDFSASILDADGDMVAQGFMHFQDILARRCRHCADASTTTATTSSQATSSASNDPYAGASHLNDIFMFRPVYKDGERICILGLILHHTDLGGRVAGGQASDSDEIYQEGLRIPPSKVYVANEPNDTLMRLIEHNTRVPDKVLGDVRAQIAALIAGEAEILKLADTYGADELKKYMRALIDYTERLVRNSIRELPDGESEFIEYNDDDGVGGGPVEIKLKLTVKNDEIIADYTGTSPQKGGALHPNYWFTASLTYAGLRTLLPPETPNNVGFYRPITVIAPPGCWVNPQFPAAVGARGQGGYRVRTVVTGAIAALSGSHASLPGRQRAWSVCHRYRCRPQTVPSCGIPQRHRTRRWSRQGRSGCRTLLARQYGEYVRRDH